MWTIIGVAVPVVLALYGLARLQHNRNSHGAQGPAESANTRRVENAIASRHADGANQETPICLQQSFQQQRYRVPKKRMRQHINTL